MGNHKLAPIIILIVMLIVTLIVTLLIIILMLMLKFISASMAVLYRNSIAMQCTHPSPSQRFIDLWFAV